VTPRLRQAVEDAINYAGGVNEALETIYELREAGEVVPPDDLRRIEMDVEGLAGHEVFADLEGFRKGYRL
jgi:hypothetical protein